VKYLFYFTLQNYWYYHLNGYIVDNNTRSSTIARRSDYSGIKTLKIVHFGVPSIVAKPQTFTFQLFRGCLLSSANVNGSSPFSLVATAVAGLRYCANVESMESRVYPALSTCRSQEIWRRADRPSLYSRNSGDRSLPWNPRVLSPYSYEEILLSQLLRVKRPKAISRDWILTA